VKFFISWSKQREGRNNMPGALKQLPAPRKTRSDAGKPRTQEASK